jgi:hypothetical protein
MFTQHLRFGFSRRCTLGNMSGSVYTNALRLTFLELTEHYQAQEDKSKLGQDALLVYATIARGHRKKTQG